MEDVREAQGDRERERKKKAKREEVKLGKNSFVLLLIHFLSWIAHFVCIFVNFSSRSCSFNEKEIFVFCCCCFALLFLIVENAKSGILFISRRGGILKQIEIIRFKVSWRRLSKVMWREKIRSKAYYTYRQIPYMNTSLKCLKYSKK